MAMARIKKAPETSGIMSTMRQVAFSDVDSDGGELSSLMRELEWWKEFEAEIDEFGVATGVGVVSVNGILSKLERFMRGEESDDPDYYLLEVTNGLERATDSTFIFTEHDQHRINVLKESSSAALLDMSLYQGAGNEARLKRHVLFAYWFCEPSMNAATLDLIAGPAGFASQALGVFPSLIYVAEKLGTPVQQARVLLGQKEREGLDFKDYLRRLLDGIQRVLIESYLSVDLKVKKATLKCNFADEAVRTTFAAQAKREPSRQEKINRTCLFLQKLAELKIRNNEIDIRGDLTLFQRFDAKSKILDDLMRWLTHPQFVFRDFNGEDGLTVKLLDFNARARLIKEWLKTTALSVEQAANADSIPSESDRSAHAFWSASKASGGSVPSAEPVARSGAPDLSGASMSGAK